jgi:NH3-dependent NAD+ synthetase
MAISKEQQFAEKLHAYTLPRTDTTNSRVKDLVDMILLIQMEAMDTAILKRAIQTTFELRGTHPVPPTVPKPPESWTFPFHTVTKECGIELTLSDALEMLSAYLLANFEARDD